MNKKINELFTTPPGLLIITFRDSNFKIRIPTDGVNTFDEIEKIYSLNDNICDIQYMGLGDKNEV